MRCKSFTFTPDGAHSKIWSSKTTSASLAQGFTLVEVLVALFILTTAIVAGLSAVNSGLSLTQVAKSKLIAANLTQEGIEVVRNIRDNNWLEQRTNPGLLWDDGLSSGEWETTYQSQNLEPYQGRFLKIDNNSFYNYTSGTDTKFKRKITIQKITNDQLRVISKVEWQEKGKPYNLTAVGDLYNWLRGTTSPSPSPPPPPPPPPPPIATETLRPNAAGDETSLTKQYPDSTEHWDKVDEETADDMATYSGVMNSQNLRDLYNLPAHSVGSGTINSITIYFRIGAGGTTSWGKPSQKSGTTVTDGTEQSVGTTFATKSQTYTTNPATGAAYTWAEIDALQIGLKLRADGLGYAFCTQVYVEVDYYQ